MATQVIEQRGVRTFAIVWTSQLVSSVGSGLTNFALSVWVYKQTGSATQFALVALFGALPNLLAAPIAGVAADRWSRRGMMIYSNVGTGLPTLLLALTLLAGRAEIWHVYVFVMVRAVFSTFMFPAFAAATTLLVPKRHLGRASGMMQTSQAASQILSPLIAGVLVSFVRLEVIVLVDFATYLLAIATLMVVNIPEPVRDASSHDAPRPSVLRDALYGWQYIRERSGLLALLVYFAVINFIIGLATVLLAPMVLSFADAKALGTIMSASGAGFLFGSLVMSAWGGPKDQVRGVLGFGVLLGFALTLVGARASEPAIMASMFVVFFTVPLINGCSQAIWQSKTEPGVQGRVFALRRMISTSVTPVSYFFAGTLADKVFGPMLLEGGALSGSVGRVIGVGPGRGLAFMFVGAGLATALVPVAAYFYPRLRLLETELPDAT